MYHSSNISRNTAAGVPAAVSGLRMDTGSVDNNGIDTGGCRQQKQ
jgi:hypothetical protein